MGLSRSVLFFKCWLQFVYYHSSKIKNEKKSRNVNVHNLLIINVLKDEEEQGSVAGSDKAEEEGEDLEDEEEYDEEEEEDDDRPRKKARHGGFILDEAG